jgi:tetratricopeptide (TPR) repeat protein
VSAAVDDAPYTLHNVQELLGLSRTVVTGLIREGFVAPVPGRRHEYRFSLRDLMLLRTAFALQQANIPPRRIFRALNTLRESLPPQLPLTGLRISAIGDQVVVRDQRGPWQADTGQFLMDFDVTERHGKVVMMERASISADIQEASTRQVNALFEEAEALEESDPDGAEMAYRQAVELDPTFGPAYINLGASLCLSNRIADALALYDEAIANGVSDATLFFNRGVALEDAGREGEAIACYEAALAIDPDLADAHFNCARLLQRRGDEQGAIRHLSAYRRLGLSR